MNKVLNNTHLISALGQTDHSTSRKHLLTKHKNLTRAWKQCSDRFKESRTVVLHGWGPSLITEDFWIPSSEALTFPGTLETLKTKLCFQWQVKELKEQPDPIKQIRVLDALLDKLSLLNTLFDLPWGSCLTQVKLYIPVVDEFKVNWPGSIRILDIECFETGHVSLNLPEGLEYFGFECGFEFAPFFPPDYIWPMSLLALRIPSGLIQARPEAFPNLKTALIDRFEDLEGKPFVPQNLEALSGTVYENLLIEAPNLKMARLYRFCVTQAPQLFSLESIHILSAQDIQILSGFCNLTCLGIRHIPENNFHLKIPPSVTSLWLSWGVSLDSLTLPLGLRALKFRFSSCNRELVLPPCLEFLQLHGWPDEIQLSPLPKLRFLYLKLALSLSDSPVCSLHVTDCPGQVSYGSLSVKERTHVNLPQLGLYQTIQDSKSIYFKRGTPDWAHGAYKALRILEQYS